LSNQGQSKILSSIRKILGYLNRNHLQLGSPFSLILNSLENDLAVLKFWIYGVIGKKAPLLEIIFSA
jgi:hypothetical protein